MGVSPRVRASLPQPQYRPALNAHKRALPARYPRSGPADIQWRNRADFLLAENEVLPNKATLYRSDPGPFGTEIRVSIVRWDVDADRHQGVLYDSESSRLPNDVGTRLHFVNKHLRSQQRTLRAAPRQTTEQLIQRCRRYQKNQLQE